MGRRGTGRSSGTIVAMMGGYLLFAIMGALLATPILREISGQMTPRLSPEGMAATDSTAGMPAEEAPFMRADYRLSSEMTTARNLLIDGISRGERTIDISPAHLRGDLLPDVYHSILDEEPATWYVRGTGEYSSDSNGFVREVTPRYLSDDAGKIQAAREEYEHAMGELLATVPDDETDVEKIRIAHDWIISRCTYNNDCADTPEAYGTALTENPYGAYAAIVQGRAVCRGYALAFKDACQRMGIECEVARTLPHEWNKVRVNGKWYNVDLTFDDKGDKNQCRYDLFMKSDAFLQDYDLSSTDDLPHLGAFPAGFECIDTSYDTPDESVLRHLLS